MNCGYFRWRVVVKPMARDSADTALLQQCTAEQLPEQLPVSVSVAAPQSLPSAAQLDQELSAVLEVSLLATHPCPDCNHLLMTLYSCRRPHCTHAWCTLYACIW